MRNSFIMHVQYIYIFISAHGIRAPSALTALLNRNSPSPVALGGLVRAKSPSPPFFLVKNTSPKDLVHHQTSSPPVVGLPRAPSPGSLRQSPILMATPRALSAPVVDSPRIPSPPCPSPAVVKGVPVDLYKLNLARFAASPVASALLSHKLSMCANS